MPAVAALRVAMRQHPAAAARLLCYSRLMPPLCPAHSPPCAAYKWEGARPRAALEPFILLLAPYAPHLGKAPLARVVCLAWGLRHRPTVAVVVCCPCRALLCRPAGTAAMPAHNRPSPAPIAA